MHFLSVVASSVRHPARLPLNITGQLYMLDCLQRFNVAHRQYTSRETGPVLRVCLCSNNYLLCNVLITDVLLSYREALCVLKQKHCTVVSHVYSSHTHHVS